jgi:hypothetical protein
MGLRMMLRGVVLFTALLVGSAQAGEYLKPDQARAFVADKLFNYTCFDGTTGSGRIHADGSVVGSIRVRGQQQPRYVTLPANTIRIKPDSICASVRGIPMTPCFNVEKIDNLTFRGSISGLGFAYCEFTRRGRVHTAETSSQPLPLRAKLSMRARSSPIKSAAATEGSSSHSEPELRLRPSTSE